MKTLAAITTAFCLFWVGACTPEEFDSASDLDVVVTVRDSIYNFAQNKTFYMPEGVYGLTEADAGTGEQGGEYDTVILYAIADAMARAGYHRLADPQDPAVDVIVTVGAVTMDYWVYGTDSWWWYDYLWWSGWWYAYPPSVVTMSFPVGSLVIAMVDPALADWEEKKVPIVWSAGMRGLLTDNLPLQIRQDVEQSFAQSTYLTVGDPVPPIYDPEIPDGGVDGGADAGDGGV